MNRRAGLAGVKAIALLWLALAGSGCVPARGYFTDRWADAKDIFTVSVGTGGGAKVRVGPLNAGLFFNSDIAGLRGGECFYVPGSFMERAKAGPHFVSSLRREWTPCSADLILVFFGGEDCDLNPAMKQRMKSYGMESFWFVPTGYSRTECPPYYYTQVEAAIGFGGTLRLGFNPGELLDFLLGWTTLDIYGDDLEARREREERKKAKEKEKPPAAPPAPPPSPADGSTKKEVHPNGR